MYLTLLTISFLINILLSYLLFRTLRRTYYFYDNMGDIIYNIQSFQGHLSQVYEMETFYGDETLQNLLEHSKELNIYLLDMEAVLGDISTEGAVLDDDEDTPEETGT